MIRDTSRPDPDRLLAAIRKDEEARRRGRLKVFFGMAAGVGKTYAMLEAARERLAEGIDIVAGYVETHGRAETEALLQGLPNVPRRQVEYRGVTLEELDLDAILARGPQLVVVDELAHSNAPGSRHPKRYQDVLELLEAGIDVYTALNVQHLESRADTVREITGVPVRETVPDSLLEMASDVELIDLTPAELLHRLAEGKVYLGEQGERAARSFFRQGNLTALREMALRLTAERVDHQLHDYMTVKRIAGPWKSGQRLMVAVSPRPMGERLVRWTRRMAYSLDAPWLAVHVETSRPLSEAERTQLSRALSLAQELGAEVVTTAGEDIVQALLRLAHERNVTQIVVGKQPSPPLHELFGRSLVARLLRHSGDIDLYVVTGEEVSVPPLPQSRWLLSLAETRQYLVATVVIVLMAALGLAALPLIGYRAVAILFLFAVSLLALVLNRGPVLLAAALSALLWDVLFIPPRFTLTVTHLEDGLMLAVYFLVALVTGSLTARLRAQERAVRWREQRATSLYRLARAVASARTLDEVLHTAVEQIREAFGASAAILLPQPSGLLSPDVHPASAFPLDSKELAVATYAFENAKEAGRYTDTLPSAQAQYLPLRAPSGTTGVMAVHWPETGRPTVDQQSLLETFARQVALVVERTVLDEAAQRATVLAESERLYKALLSSISHELRTPLAAISGAASSLLEPDIAQDVEARTSLSNEIVEASSRLNRVIENLLNMTRLESGRLKLKLEWCDVGDLIAVVLGRASRDLEGHEVVRDVADGLPLVKLDFGLMELALYNLLHNAAVHTPPGTRVRITARVEADELLLIVADRGPGLAPGDLERIFDKFYTATGTPGRGTGLGLSITRALIEAHGGRISAENRSNGGARFTVRLPLSEQPQLPVEEV